MTTDQVTPRRIRTATQKWLEDRRVQNISDGLVKFGVANILGGLVADRKSKARPIEFTQHHGSYAVEQAVIRQCSRHTNETLMNDIGLSLAVILGCDVKNIDVYDDDNGMTIFTYFAT